MKKTYDIITYLPLNQDSLEATLDTLQAEIERQTGMKLVSSLVFEASTISYLAALRISGEEIYLFGTSLKNSSPQDSLLEVEFYFSTNNEKIYQVLFGFLIEKELPLTINL